MKKIILFGFLLSSVSFAGISGANLDYALRGKLRRTHPAMFLANNTKSDWFTQKLDHENPADNRTFKQRYFVDSSYASAPDAPVIHFFCGEGACSNPFWGSVRTLAQNMGAHMVALEHRYYGESQPFDRLTAENLKYLKMYNALEDVADFQRYAMDQLGLKGKWLAAGGSYSGTLASLFRMTHPELVAGALASSAPEIYRTDFVQYDGKVAEIAGPKCAAAAREVSSQVEEALKDPVKAAQMRKLFDGGNIKDDQDFLAATWGPLAAAIQYGQSKAFCNSIVGTNDVVSAYVKASQKLLNLFGFTLEEMSFSWAESDAASKYSGDIGWRQWYYQTCTEYGNFQVSNHENPDQATLSPRVDKDFNLRICKKLFGTQPDVDTTNKVFYQRILDPATSHILFTNGYTDPYSSSSIVPEQNNVTNPNTIVDEIKSGAHCSDMQSQQADDPSDLRDARATFAKLAKEWLQ